MCKKMFLAVLAVATMFLAGYVDHEVASLTHSWWKHPLVALIGITSAMLFLMLIYDTAVDFVEEEAVEEKGPLETSQDYKQLSPAMQAKLLSVYGTCTPSRITGWNADAATAACSTARNTSRVASANNTQKTQVDNPPTRRIEG